MRSVIALVALAVLLLLSACGDGQEATPTPTPTSTATPAGQGTLMGTVSIGPLCPVEPCPGPTPDVYSSRELILQPESGGPIGVQLDPEGDFEATLRAGTYAVDLSDCDFLGCSLALPTTVAIEPDEVTRLYVDIDTGIR